MTHNMVLKEVSHMVERSDINSVLMQLRQVRDQIKDSNQIQGVEDATATERLAKEVDKVQHVQKESANYPDIKTDPNVPDFQTMFANAVNTVNAKQMHSSSLARRFEKGDPQVDLPEVMIAAQKASVSFEAMKQVRNKLVDAYKDIMNMPV